MMLFKKVSGCRYGKNNKAQKAVIGLLSLQDFHLQQLLSAENRYQELK